jgi:hypothetical protein
MTRLLLLLIWVLLLAACAVVAFFSWPANALDFTATCSGARVQLYSTGCHPPGRYVVDACGTVSDTLECSSHCVMQPVEVPDCGERPEYRRVE